MWVLVMIWLSPFGNATNVATMSTDTLALCEEAGEYLVSEATLPVTYMCVDLNALYGVS